MNDFMFLTEQQMRQSNVFGQVMDAQGTEFAFICANKEIKPLRDREDNYWSGQLGADNKPKVMERGRQRDYIWWMEEIMSRPATTYDNLKKMGITAKERADRGNYKIIEAGEYPQTIVSSSMENTLNKLYTSNSPNIKETNQVFTMPEVTDQRQLSLLRLKVYEYNGEKFVRVRMHTHSQNKSFTFFSKNGQNVQQGSYCWVKVEPIEWVVDKKANLALARHPLYAGVPVWANGNPSFKIEDLYLYKFMNDVFAKEIVQDRAYIKPSTNSKEQQIKGANPYNFAYEDLTVDDLLKAYVQAGQSVFLHGPSGVGKSARVKQLDPTATRITLRPQMNPEEIDGTLNRETGEYIPPLWYTQLCEKCKAEPDRKHILFIDELTNVKPTVQSLVYSIVLDRAGKDGLWPLPDNAVVVGAGNENADNLAAYPMTNALYRRFCHIYFEVNVNTWIEWATGIKRYNEINSIENDSNDQFLIHPYILAFVISRGINILYQDLDEENPQIVTDPRKWEIASSVFYATNNPNALFPALGNSITNEFINFTKDVLLSVDDVVNDKVKDVDYKGMDETYKKSIIAGLTIAKVEDLNEVRKFIADNFEDNYLTMFDAMWTHNEPDRMKIIQSLQNNKTTKKSLSKTILSKKEETNISQNDLQKNEEILTPQIEDKPIEDKPKNKKRLREFFR